MEVTRLLQLYCASSSFGQDLSLGEASQITSLVLFASLQLDWATTTSRMLGPATCLPHKDGGIRLDVLPNDKTSKLAGLLSIQSPLKPMQ